MHGHVFLMFYREKRFQMVPTMPKSKKSTRRYTILLFIVPASLSCSLPFVPVGT